MSAKTPAASSHLNDGVSRFAASPELLPIGILLGPDGGRWHPLLVVRVAELVVRKHHPDHDGGEEEQREQERPDPELGRRAVAPPHAQLVGEQHYAGDHRQDPEREDDVGEPLRGSPILRAVSRRGLVAAGDEGNDSEQDRQHDADDHEPHRPR